MDERRNVIATVIVPIYNAGGYILNLLNDLYNQTFVNTEFILVNDGSTDDTEKILASFINENRDSRFQVIQQRNAGVSQARNVGLDNATGDFIIFVDSDDRIPPMFVEKYVGKIVEHGTDMEFFSAKKYADYSLNKQVGVIDYQPIASETSKSVYEMIENFSDLRVWGYPFCFITKKSIWGDVRFSTDIDFQEDVLAIFSVWCKHPTMQIGVNGEGYYCYVMNEGSALHTLSVNQSWQFVEVDNTILKLVSEKFDSKLFHKLYALKISSLMIIVANALLENNFSEYRKARGLFISQFRLATFSPKIKFRRKMQLFLLKMNFWMVIRMIYRRV